MNIVCPGNQAGGKYHGLLERSQRTLVDVARVRRHWLRGLPAADYRADHVVRVIAMQHPQQTTLAELRARLAMAENEVVRIQYADDFCFSNGSYDRAVRVRDEFKHAVEEAEQDARLLAAGIATASGEPGV